MITALPNKPVQVIADIIAPQANYPNNDRFSLLIYKSVFSADQLSSTGIKNLLQQNGWGDAWVNGVYDFHHYHSNTHEVLVILSGWCNVMYGGPKGKIYKVSAGDVVIHPAGVSHKKTDASENFTCSGAYPNAVKYDMRYGKENLSEMNLKIKKVDLPEMDPIFGEKGILFNYWE